ncbi:hypothetical protein SARC_01532 [Sphaeroforma arctica JP610]|uniref:Rho-GAP domain-containing protein n=1 Tax=Sphaeroforma arctica JP610 TaxID=667725 RepID=A0A0L0GDH6_9EUKA|nr:hypothetical protein SARC_01532 [Sphaeroforma arctica JP610]KNC86308.1 hypothetical protein SARC_01532 [Sphaeroforma arctica JP610]|eukprot:XP_014160210.1 hypothetical protein SARC_01532 [Sphaeroforma arctica JP610]
MSKAFSRLKQRVVEATGKAEATVALSGEMQDAELRVAQYKTSYESVLRSAEATCLTKRHADVEKRVTRLPKKRLAENLRVAAETLNVNEGVGLAMLHVATVEEDLCKVIAEYEKGLDDGFLAQCQGVIDNAKRITASRVQLENRRLDRDIARKDMVKAPVEKSHEFVSRYNDAQALFEEAKDKTESGMVDLMATEPDMVVSLLNYCEAQQKMFKAALEYMNETVDILKREAYSSKLFSRTIVDYAKDTGYNIPPIVEHCIWALDDRVSEEGIFRMSGNTNTIRCFRSSFNTEDPNLNLKDQQWDGEHHAIAGVLKLYFRELPDPLLDDTLYDEWVAAAKVSDHDDKLYAIKALLKRLPSPNHDTLLCLLRFLAKVVTFSDKNKMKASNLGIVFGPTLLRQKEELMSMGTALADTGALASVVEYLITYYSWFFDDDSDVQTVMYFMFDPENPGGSYPASKATNSANSLSSKSTMKESTRKKDKSKSHRKSLSHSVTSVPSAALSSNEHSRTSSTKGAPPAPPTGACKSFGPLSTDTAPPLQASLSASHVRSHSMKVKSDPIVSRGQTAQTQAEVVMPTAAPPATKARPKSTISASSSVNLEVIVPKKITPVKPAKPTIPTKPGKPLHHTGTSPLDAETPQAAMARAMMGTKHKSIPLSQDESHSGRGTKNPPRGPPPPLPGAN